MLLAGCGKEEVVEEPPHIPISTQADQYTLGNVTIQSKGMFTGYVDNGNNSVSVYPYYDLNEHFSMRLILISGQDWWSTLTQDVEVMYGDNYEIWQSQSGATYGYLEIDNEHALYITSETLPIDYVRLYLDSLWLSDI